MAARFGVTPCGVFDHEPILPLHRVVAWTALEQAIRSAALVCGRRAYDRRLDRDACALPALPPTHRLLAVSAHGSSDTRSRQRRLPDLWRDQPLTEEPRHQYRQ